MKKEHSKQIDDLKVESDERKISVETAITEENLKSNITETLVN
jgi:hypothetical protein